MTLLKPTGRTRYEDPFPITAALLVGVSELTGKTTHGYFGIRHRNERNTKYDDFQIILYEHEVMEEGNKP